MLDGYAACYLWVLKVVMAASYSNLVPTVLEEHADNFLAGVRRHLILSIHIAYILVALSQGSQLLCYRQFRQKVAGDSKIEVTTPSSEERTASALRVARRGVRRDAMARATLKKAS